MKRSFMNAVALAMVRTLSATQPVPGPLGRHDAAVGVFEEDGGVAVR